ncbi:glycoside hydrolase family 28 protein [Desertivirga arenae]|uniref:glycoside hydrolase family 28 protein n=1 Tax=Desertivirga arenae TaxID=2810309 RepID=UPI001A96DAB5|nr:glycosyl hydrolase family 28 protein [Pedobacter sp. SYSU D00823]
MNINKSVGLLGFSFILMANSNAGNISKISVTTQSIVNKADKTYNIAEHGAIGDSKTLNTKSIQNLIDKCSENGGGTIVIPQGVFLSGSLFLKPGVNIELKAGAVLKGSTDINDYVKLNTRIEGHFEPWRAALLNGDKVDHLRISGPGTLDGSGEPFYKEFYGRREKDKKTTNLSVERPRLTFIQNSKDVKITGVKFLNSGFWNLHIYRCQNASVENCSFIAPSGPTPNRGPSSDGIDVDSSQDITIKGCYFSVGDDCIALKGSKGPFAMQDMDSPAVERVHISDCVYAAGGGIVTFGSEATIVRDVEVKNCTTMGPTVLRLKLRPDTPQQYENISISNITMENGGVIFKVSPWTQYFDLKGQEPPKALVRNISITKVRGSGNSFGQVIGHERATIENIVVKDVEVKLKSNEFEVGNVTGLEFKKVKVNGAKTASPQANSKQLK